MCCLPEEEMTLLPPTRLVKELTVPATAVTIAGFDPSSGAGMTADLQVFTAHGIYGVAAITALTVQSTQGVRRVETVAAETVRETLDCLAEDLSLDGVKIGMLGSTAVVRALAAFLREARIPRERVVLDPVLRSSSGRDLLEPEGIERVREELLGLVGWATPNIDELAALLGEGIADREEIPAQARRLAALGGAGLQVVVTGGHLEPPDDFLLTAAGEERWFPGKRVATSSTHGTGCAFSSALLCRLLLGDGAVNAVAGAKAFVRGALATAVPVGKGRGGLLVQREPLRGTDRVRR